MTQKKRRNKGEFAVVVVCIIVGYLLAAQLRTVVRRMPPMPAAWRPCRSCTTSRASRTTPWRIR